MVVNRVMNEGCMIVKCDKCGGESQLMMRSVRTDSFICPVCLENEIECELTGILIRANRGPASIVRILYPYVTDQVTISFN
jgi:hypothetical protein